MKVTVFHCPLIGSGTFPYPGVYVIWSLIVDDSYCTIFGPKTLKNAQWHKVPYGISQTRIKWFLFFFSFYKHHFNWSKQKTVVIYSKRPNRDPEGCDCGNQMIHSSSTTAGKTSSQIKSNKKLLFVWHRKPFHFSMWWETNNAGCSVIPHLQEVIKNWHNCQTMSPDMFSGIVL